MLYAVVGDGTGNKTEITATLEDLKAKAEVDGADFWFSLIAKETLTSTDKVILKWLQDEGIWYDVIGDADEEVYLGASRTHGSKDPYRTTLGLLTETNAEEGSMLLALYVDSEAEDEADNELAMLAERVNEEGIEIRLLNGQMVRLDFSGEDDEAEVEEDDVEDEEPLTFTEAELKAKAVPELRAIARSQGIDGKDLRKPDLVVALMAKFNGEDEDEAPAPARGASKKAAAARAALAAVPEEDEAEELAAATTMLDSRDNSKVHAAIVVFVDGAITVLPVSIGHARSVLAGK